LGEWLRKTVCEEERFPEEEECFGRGKGKVFEVGEFSGRGGESFWRKVNGLEGGKWFGRRKWFRRKKVFVGDRFRR
jgi:hypothetical protein